MPTLSSDAIAVLDESCPAALSQSFGDVIAGSTAHGWLGPRNSYRSRFVKKLRADLKNGSVKHADLSRYIAASSLLHAADGWAFLGRAMSAHAAGDSYVARHLAYYAELRGALSVLASQGIGVFDDKHTIVDARAKCRKVPGNSRTHDMVWLGLEHWAGKAGSADLLAEIVRPAGIPLSKWLASFNTTSSWRPVGQEWLSTWGLDLRNFSRDRDARNEASYRPSGIIGSGSTSALQTSRFLRGLWSSYEPNPISVFEQVDLHLLRLGLERAFKAVKGTTHRRSPVAYRRRIQSMLDELHFPDGASDRYRRFLLRQNTPNDCTPVALALTKPNSRTQDYHLQVISRASLLLRVAAGTSGKLLSDNKLKLDDLKFWWSPLALERGLWEAAAEPANLADLWQDIDDAIEAVETWENGNLSSAPSLADFKRHCGTQACLLANCELIGLWGLAGA